MSLAENAAHYYGQGKEVKNKDGWLTLCACHGNKNTPALAVADIGNGDVKVFCHAGCTFQEIKDRFRADGLLPEWTPDRTKARKSINPPPKQPSMPKAPEKPSFIWKQADRDHDEDIIKYLDSRGIKINQVPDCFKWNSYETNEGGKVEMIVAAASKPTDKAVYAVQRLFINTDTHTKGGAKMHGPCDGRAVWPNRSGEVKKVAVTEGIETNLSVMQATGMNGAAALSTSGMKNMIFPDETDTIYLFVDSDPVREMAKASMPGQKAAYIAAENFINSREGRRAFLVSPDDSCWTDNPTKLDFNDLLAPGYEGESIGTRYSKAVEYHLLDWSPEVLGEKEIEDDGGNGQYPPATLEALRGMKKIYASVLLNSEFRIVRESVDRSTGRGAAYFIKQSSFFAHHSNEKVMVRINGKEVKRKELARVYMGWEERRKYDDVVFDPSGNASPSAYNLFRGFPLTPKEGDWSLMRKHMFEVICSGNSEHFEYFMGWMARAVQDPGGDKPGVAIVLKGGKGIGKGVFVNYFGEIFGEAFLPIADSESFTGRFNMHLSKSLVVFLDEAVWGGDKKAEGKLKQLITEPTVMFEPKGIDSMALHSYINVIIASNEDWVIPATGDERRFCVLEPSAVFQQDTEYFGKLIKEKRSGGVEAMMYDLLNYDFSHIDLRKAPMTTGLSDQVKASLESVPKFWHSLIDREIVLTDSETGEPVRSSLSSQEGSDVEYWPTGAFKYELYREYVQYCKTQNERYPSNESYFWRDTWSVWPGGAPKKRVLRKDSNGKQVDAVLMPTLQEARKAFTEVTKVGFENKGDDDDTESVTLPFNGEF